MRLVTCYGVMLPGAESGFEPRRSRQSSFGAPTEKTAAPPHETFPFQLPTTSVAPPAQAWPLLFAKLNRLTRWSTVNSAAGKIALAIDSCRNCKDLLRW